MSAELDRGCALCGAKPVCDGGLCIAHEAEYQEYVRTRPYREGTRAGSGAEPIKTGKRANPQTRFQWSARRKSAHRKAKEVEGWTKEVVLRVEGRASLLSLQLANKDLIARDKHHRVWIKGEDGLWRCYGSLVERVGHEVPQDK